MAMLIDRYRANRDRIRQMGESAIARAHAAGVAAYYRDETGDIVRHAPDGTRTPVEPRILRDGTPSSLKGCPIR